MEPIQTPTNEALDLQIHALKARISILEREIDYVRDIARVDNDRCMRWEDIQDRSISRLWFMSLLLSLSIILHGISHIIGIF